MLDNKTLIDLQEYVQSHILSFGVFETSYNLENNYSQQEIMEDEMKNFIEVNRRPSLKIVLFSFIDQTGVSDSEIYHKAGIDRKLFSKIRSNPNYRPGKNTIIALAIALELSIEETDTLLGSAGYTLSDSDTHDLVIQFCIERKIYNIHDVNEALDSLNLKPLIS